MSEGTTTKRLKLRDIWRTCNKIRAAIFRVGLNLWDYYKPLDPNGNNLLSESKFVSVLAGPLRGSIGLSDQEIGELADYFRVQDGRVLYAQFCEVIQDSVAEFGNDSGPLVTGLEWEDPLQVNRLSVTEHRKLNLIVTQIALLVTKRKLAVRPYFQDYELIAKNAGTVTITHFGRVLSFLGIVLAAEEFRLLVKRFAKDSYTVNYVAFLATIDEAQNCIERNRFSDLAGNSLDQFPGRVITAELPKLPRPEIGRVTPSEVYGRQTVFHPVTEQREGPAPLREVVCRIQRHVLEHRIRIRDFFKDFDPLNAGRVTTSQFRRALDALRVSTLGRLYLAESEIDAAIALYRDPNDPDRVCWLTFEDDVDRVFTVKELDKLPTLRIDPPPRETKMMRRKGRTNWQAEKKDTRELCEDTLRRVRRRVAERNILLKQFFKDYDRHNRGHVTRTQMRQVIATAGILLSCEELYALERRYNDELGFDYSWFLKEIESLPIETPLYRAMLKERRRINAEGPATTAAKLSQDETDIVAVLAKIKAKLVRERIKVTEFIRPFDTRNEMVVEKSDFVRGLDQLRCNLTCTEVATVVAAFQAPLRPGFVEYAKFGTALEEALTIGSLERSPLLVPVQHVPSEACGRTFLNFDERRILARAMDKLCGPRNTNLEEIFTDHDKENIGTVPKDSLIKALSVRNMLCLVSSTELDVVHKCFAVERGGRLELDYRAFLRALHLLQENKKTLPLY